MHEQAPEQADELGTLRKNIFLLLRFCAFIGPSSNPEVVLHVLGEIDRLKARYHELRAARAGESSAGLPP